MINTFPYQLIVIVIFAVVRLYELTFAMAAVPCISLNCRSEHWILVYALRYCELSYLWLLKKQALDF